MAEWVDLDEVVGERHHEDDVFHLHRTRILAELAGWIRPRGARFTLTREGRRMLEPGREGERYARLFETCFRRFDLGYGTAREWTEGQHQVAFTLYRLGAVALDWVTARTLLDRRTVVPGAQGRLQDDVVEREAAGLPRFDLPASTFETYLLLPLEDFGLVESRWEEETRARTWRVTSRYSRLLEFDLEGREGAEAPSPG